MNIPAKNAIEVLVASLDGFTEKSVQTVQQKKRTLALDPPSPYTYWKDQLRTEVGIVLTEHLLCQLGIDEQTLHTLKRNNFGRPFLPHQDIDFNVSHSENFVVAVCSTTKSVGIDIEHNRSVDVSAYESIFHPEEWALLKSQKALNIFFEIWTKKESLLKARGIGFQFDLAMLNTLESASEHHFHSIQIPDYTCFVCSTFPCDNIVVNYCNKASDLFLCRD